MRPGIWSALRALATATLILVFPVSGQAETQTNLPRADAVAYESFEQIDTLASKGPTVVYFHATWCPTCQAAMTSFRGRWPEVKAGITLVIADYDDEVQLKSRYGITYQNTYVQVSPDGTPKSVWNGGGIAALNDNTIFD